MGAGTEQPARVDPPRIPPRPIQDWDAEVKDALSVLRLPRTSVPPEKTGPSPTTQPPGEQPRRKRRPGNLIGVLSWHPALMKAWFAFNNHLFDSTISDRLREIVTVRTAWQRRSEYEWAQHVAMARMAGLDDVEIAALATGPDAPEWDDAEAAALRATDELCATRRITDPTWTALEEHFDRRQVMDIVFTVAAYDALGMALENFDIELDEGAATFAAHRGPADDRAVPGADR